MCAIGVWSGTGHLIQDKVILKAIAVDGGGGADAEGIRYEWPWPAA